MTYRHVPRRGAAVAGCALWLLGAGAPAAEAHPLGNFSVNHYTGLTVHSDHVEVLAVTDTAEIPTLQAAPDVDTDGDGDPSDAERTAWAGARCAETAGRLAVTSAPGPGVPAGPRQRLGWTVTSASFTYRPGQASLRTSRLECRLRAPLDLTGGPVALRVDTGADPTRVGWNEITARGDGARLRGSGVPETSASDELRNYPRDLLDTPRGDTRAGFTALAGETGPGTGGGRPGTTAADGPTARLEGLARHLGALTGAERLTVPVGLLAVLLSVVLGAGHALLPGHGKTVMAAYLAGRRGRTRDAVTVGATVTVTHTAGVLVVGLALTSFSALAGDAVLGWLGVVSGALVALVGAGLLADARRGHRRRRATHDHPEAHRHQEDHKHHEHEDHHSHHVHRENRPDAGPTTEEARRPVLVGAALATAVAEVVTDGQQSAHRHQQHHKHDQPHGHDHPHHGQPHAHAHHEHPHHGRPHRHGLLGHRHSHGPAAPEPQPFTTRGLVGLGVAGGLVPSPSALVVLLGAVALGRTWFGAALVVAYGFGMAATLTAVGLLLVRIGDRLGRLATRPAYTLLRRLTPYTAPLTAVLVLVVGLGLMARSLPPLL
ncbi:high frequency lysogenization protein HflD [Streptomyces sp. CB03911]|uniref:HoxN/HupN/NixA family nickel/cobalt transporter n=1 Tax=Streptomyces sp. CB03911 TaxID=1804758 RepID=UPI00093B5B59|nr:high frequency lysogenization protein HflD [Streptomyces sp. CB03911]